MNGPGIQSAKKSERGFLERSISSCAGLETHNFMGVGAAGKAAIQLVKVQPYQLLVSDM